MIDFEEEVRVAIELADEVTVDGQFQLRNVHYLRPVGARPPIRVVANYLPAPPDIWVGEVITAFRSERKNKGEQTIWP